MDPSRAKSPSEPKAETSAEKVPAMSSRPASTVPLSPSDVYSPRCAEIARDMRSRGATDAELCAALEVSAETLVVWQGQFAEFAKACEANEVARQRRVKDCLFELAVGFVRKEKKIVTEGGKRKSIITEVDVAPNLEAIKLFLSGQQVSETDLAALLRQMGEMRTHRFRPVPLRPGEEKTLEGWPFK